MDVMSGAKKTTAQTLHEDRLGRWYLMGFEEGVHSIRCAILHFCSVGIEEVEYGNAWDLGYKEGKELALTFLAKGWHT